MNMNTSSDALQHNSEFEQTEGVEMVAQIMLDISAEIMKKCLDKNMKKMFNLNIRYDFPQELVESTFSSALP